MLATILNHVQAFGFGLMVGGTMGVLIMAIVNVASDFAGE